MKLSKLKVEGKKCDSQLEYLWVLLLIFTRWFYFKIPNNRISSQVEAYKYNIRYKQIKKKK